MGLSDSSILLPEDVSAIPPVCVCVCGVCVCVCVCVCLCVCVCVCVCVCGCVGGWVCMRLLCNHKFVNTSQIA